MTIENISNPGEDPVEGDWIRITYPSGGYTEKQFHETPVIPQEEINLGARGWRDGELAASDWIVPVTDHPKHSEWLAYRVTLRDWPATEDFPDKQPIAPIG